LKNGPLGSVLGGALSLPFSRTMQRFRGGLVFKAHRPKTRNPKSGTGLLNGFTPPVPEGTDMSLYRGTSLIRNRPKP